MTSRHVFIALGSNLPDGEAMPADTLDRALRLCNEADLSIEDCSDYFVTPSVPDGSGPDFVNAVARATSGLPPVEVIGVLNDIERKLGRDRGRRWAPRVIDLDLLAVGRDILPDLRTYEQWRDLPPDLQGQRTPETLILPHPRIQDRAFVLVPLAEIAPDWRHPVLGLSARQMRDARPLQELARIRVLRSPKGV